jgi:hypothetical protein
VAAAVIGIAGTHLGHVTGHRLASQQAAHYAGMTSGASGGTDDSGRSHGVHDLNVDHQKDSVDSDHGAQPTEDNQANSAEH